MDIELIRTLLEDGKETFEALLQAGGYGYKHEWITAHLFPIRPTLPGRTIVVVHFGRKVRTQDVLLGAREGGLERPTYEDCFRFGVQYPPSQRPFACLFLHEPVSYNYPPTAFGHPMDPRDWGNAKYLPPSVLYLDLFEGQHYLDLVSDSGENDWLPDCRFGFVRPWP